MTESIKKKLKEIELEVGVVEFSNTEGKDGSRAVCVVTGEPYVTIAWDFTGNPIKPEAAQAIHYPTKEAAWALWFAAFNEYRRTRKGRIHWRARPTLYDTYSYGPNDWGEKKHTGYVVGARVFIEEGDGKA